MLQLDKSISKPYYVQIYEYYRREIEERRMVAGMRLDSVRELAQAAGISKMTVEKAYYQLASEGCAVIRLAMKWLPWEAWSRGQRMQRRRSCARPAVVPSMLMILPAAIWPWNASPSTSGGNI